jgi:hypothetical protein
LELLDRPTTRAFLFLLGLAVLVPVPAMPVTVAAHHGGYSKPVGGGKQGLDMAGTATYEWPATGAMAPTALQVADQVTALITSDGNPQATSAVITHNMGLSPADLAAGRPVVTIERIRAVAIAESWIVALQDANSITLSQVVVGGGAGANIRVTVQRPHSMRR